MNVVEQVAVVAQEHTVKSKLRPSGPPPVFDYRNRPSMVADRDIVAMSELNKIRTDRLANALKTKSGDIGRSQSTRNRRVVNASTRNSSARGTPSRAGRAVNVMDARYVDDLEASSEFRRRACTMPSGVKTAFSPIYSRAPMLSPSSRNAMFFDAVPTPTAGLGPGNDNEPIVVERMRTFTLDADKAAVINRGDSFRCRSNTTGAAWRATRGGRSLNGSPKNNSNLSSRSHSPAPAAIADSPADVLPPEDSVRKYYIIVLGSVGVGKTSMINQFMTSDYCNPFQTESGECPDENTVNVLLDGEESQLTFIEVNNKESDMWLSLSGDGYIVVYSVDDLSSFRNAEQALYELRQSPHASRKPIILVANKIDLERKRHVSAEDGRHAAKEFSCKFVEIAVALCHHVDELLVGVLAQARINENNPDPSIPGSKSDLVATFDAMFPAGLQPHSRSSSGSSSGSNNGGTRAGRGRNQKKPLLDKEPRQNGVQKWGSLKKLDDKVSTGCAHMATVGGRFVQKLFGRRRRSHSLEDLLAFQRR